MPIKHESWECSICHEIWGTEEQALNCERSHPTILKTEFVYSDDAHSTIYPDFVRVTFDDETVRDYEH